MGRPGPRAAAWCARVRRRRPPVADDVRASPRRRPRDRRRLRARARPRARRAGRPRRRRPRLGRSRRCSTPRSPTGPAVERHPAAKDATDLELALDAARRPRRHRGARGRRRRRPPRPLPRQRAAARRRPRSPTSHVDARVGDALVTVVARARRARGHAGRRCARCCPLGGPAAACSPTGCGSRCAARPRPRHRPAGVSNEFLGDQRHRLARATACSWPSNPASRKGRLNAPTSSCSPSLLVVAIASSPPARVAPAAAAAASDRRPSRSSPTTRSRSRRRCWPRSRSGRASR